MNKRGLLFIIVLFFTIAMISLAHAQIDNSTAVGRAQQCIVDAVGDDCSKLSNDQIPYAILGIGNYETCGEALNATSRIPKEGQQCWPSANCKVKDTALAILAMYQLNKDSTDAENWLLSQTKIASDLDWYLQITPDEPATCTITYDSTSVEVNILEDEKISGSVSGCLSIDSAGYWLRISSQEECISKKYNITCNKPFKTNLIYKTSTSPIIHVSQRTHEGAADDSTTEEVNYECFKRADGACDYEGTLWAAIALEFRRSGHSSSIYIPYLESKLTENSAMFPEAFLTRLGLSEYRQDVFSSFGGQYWGTGSERFYKTAIAFLALSEGDTQVNKAKEYLEGEGIQGEDGCWNNLKDTGLLLYFGWPTERPPFPPTPDNGDEELKDCLLEGYFCEYSIDCLSSGGIVYDEYRCSGGLRVCCSKKYEVRSCSDQGGYVCSTGYICPSDAYELTSSDIGICCSDVCVEEGDRSECEIRGGSCEFSCTAAEESRNYACSSASEVCCFPKAIVSGCVDNSDCEKGFKCKDGDCVEKSSKWWLWVLIILIILGVVLYFFKDKIIKSKKKPKEDNVQKSSSSAPKPPMQPPMQPPRGMPPQGARAQPRPVFPQHVRKPIPAKSSKDTEFEDTLKKLKEMSK